MSFINFLTNLLKSVIKDLGGKPKVSVLIPTLLVKIIQAIEAGREFAALGSKEKFDDALEGFDLQTGDEDGALNLVKDLPDDKEEELLDHFKELVRIAGYRALKVEGYYVPGA